MDEGTVRDAAEGHGRAVVDKDFRRAGSDLTPEMQSVARDVMSQFPKEITSAEVIKVEGAGEEFTVHARYSGSGGEVVVESRWGERDGAPKIVAMQVV